MMRQEEFRPALICNGTDLNGNAYPLRQLPLGVFEMFIRPVTVPIFAANGHRLHLQQLPPRMNEMHPDRVRIWKLMPGPPPGFERAVPPQLSEWVPLEVLQERASDNAKTPELEDEAKKPGTPVNFASCNERFDGLADIRPFIDDVLEFKKSSNMDDEFALQSFPLLLTGQAKRWWQANNASVTDWDSVIKLLRNRYRDFPLRTEIEFRPIFCVPQLNSFDEYVERVSDLLTKVFQEHSTEEAQLDKIYSMLHRSIKRKLSRTDCTNLTELYNRANRVADEIGESMAQPLAPLNAPVDPGTPEDPATSPTLVHLSGGAETSCKHCISYGDLLIRMCRKLHKGQRTAEELQLLEKINQMGKDELSKMKCSRCRSSNVMSLNRHKSASEISGSCPLITVRIFEEDFNVVVDTGSSLSVASEELMAYFFAKGQKVGSKVWVTPSTVGDTPMQQVVRVATVEVVVADVKIPTEFVEFPGVGKNVFGMDFIRKAGLVLDFRGAGTWTVRGATEEQPVLYERLNRLPKAR